MPVNTAAEASAVKLSGDSPTMTVASNNWPDNTVRVPMTAVRTSGYTIICRLVAEGGND